MAENVTVPVFQAVKYRSPLIELVAGLMKETEQIRHPLDGDDIHLMATFDDGSTLTVRFDVEGPED